EPLGTANSTALAPVVMRPILLAENSVNHSLPSGPGATPHGLEEVGNSVTAPERVMRPRAPFSVNQTLPSGPGAISNGELFAVTGKSVTVPAGVIRPILSVSRSVNHSFPSGPG